MVLENTPQLDSKYYNSWSEHTSLMAAFLDTWLPSQDVVVWNYAQSQWEADRGTTSRKRERDDTPSADNNKKQKSTSDRSKGKTSSIYQPREKEITCKYGKDQVSFHRDVFGGDHHETI